MWIALELRNQLFSFKDKISCAKQNMNLLKFAIVRNGGLQYFLIFNINETQFYHALFIL
jgi:hypothetical protein